MKDILLPSFSHPRIPPKRLTMDEYSAFVQLVYRTLPDRERARTLAQKRVPTVRFSLTPQSNG
jgi:hypothetical protein